MKILSGTSNLKLSKDISKNLKLKLINTNIKRFADGEIYIEVNENIRGNSVFVIQSTSNPNACKNLCLFSIFFYF